MNRAVKPYKEELMLENYKENQSPGKKTLRPAALEQTASLVDRARELIHVAFTKEADESTKALVDLAGVYSLEIGGLLNPIPKGAVPSIIVALEAYARELRSEVPMAAEIADGLAPFIGMIVVTRDAKDGAE